MAAISKFSIILFKIYFVFHNFQNDSAEHTTSLEMVRKIYPLESIGDSANFN